MELFSKNLYLRESTFEDCKLFAIWEQKDYVNEFFTINLDRNYEEVVREFLEREGDNTQIQFTICLREDEKPIDRIYISNINSHYDSVDITRMYLATKEIIGKGYGEDSFRLAFSYGFDIR